jgi:hypothetical protein
MLHTEWPHQYCGRAALNNVSDSKQIQDSNPRSNIKDKISQLNQTGLNQTNKSNQATEQISPSSIRDRVRFFEQSKQSEQQQQPEPVHKLKTNITPSVTPNQEKSAKVQINQEIPIVSGHGMLFDALFNKFRAHVFSEKCRPMKAENTTLN